MTELSCLAMRHPYPEHDDTGSLGRLMPNIDAKCISPPTSAVSPHLNDGSTD